MITKEASFTLTSPAVDWIVALPIGAMYAQIDALFDLSGNLSEETYSAEYLGNAIILHFRLEPFAGTLIYKYRIDETPAPPEDKDVTVNVGNCCSAYVDHQVIHVTNRTDPLVIKNNSIYSRPFKYFQLKDIQEDPNIKEYEDCTDSIGITFSENVTTGQKYITISVGTGLELNGFVELY